MVTTTHELNVKLISFIRSYFEKPTDFIALHEPVFGGNEKAYVLDTIHSTFVSSVGEYVNRFEKMMCEITGAKYAVAIVNGTSALHLALILNGINNGDEVITQPFTFVATTNAIRYCGAHPHFVDIEKESVGMCPLALEKRLNEIAEVRDGICYNKYTNRRIAACMPMHTYGHPCKIDDIEKICSSFGIALIEDSAESLGSYYKGKHTGTFGKMGVFSFNGNKTFTSGGGGCIITDDEQLAEKGKYLSTTAKRPHTWEFFHDEVAFNYRLPNLNAALACAQLEQFDTFLSSKRTLANKYKDFFNNGFLHFNVEPPHTSSNYWLCSVLFPTIKERNAFLDFSNKHGVMTRPAWKLMCDLPMFKDCEKGDLTISRQIEERLVCLPSSVK